MSGTRGQIPDSKDKNPIIKLEHMTRNDAEYRMKEQCCKIAVFDQVHFDIFNIDEVRAEYQACRNDCEIVMEDFRVSPKLTGEYLLYWKITC